MNLYNVPSNKYAFITGIFCVKPYKRLKFLLFNFQVLSESLFISFPIANSYIISNYETIICNSLVILKYHGNSGFDFW